MKEFVWPVRVYYEDTDSGGVVYYANYLKYMERARTEWLRSLGIEQNQLQKEQGVIFAVRSAHLEYLKPARFNDNINVVSVINEQRRTSLTFDQHVIFAGELGSPTPKNSVLCTGRIKVACLDSARFRPRPIPEFILAEITRDH